MQFTVEQVTVWAFSFGAYYLGIVIRKMAMPGPDSPSLPKQFLLGIPVSLLVVSALSFVLEAALRNATSNSASILVAIGLIVEHGMVLNETVAKHLKQRLEGPAGS